MRRPNLNPFISQASKVLDSRGLRCVGTFKPEAPGLISAEVQDRITSEPRGTRYLRAKKGGGFEVFRERP